jgi:hypothetical protein
MNNTGGNEKIQLVIREAAAAIVAAINKQPIFTGGINAPYYG